MTQHQIVVQVGCSHSTVGNAIREAGVSMRQRRPRGALERTVSRTWLEDEYQHKGRGTSGSSRPYRAGDLVPADR